MRFNGAGSPQSGAEETPFGAARVVMGGLHGYEKGVRQESYRRGTEGEELVVSRMANLLDYRWTIFRNVVLPAKRGDIDIVLVGPPGIWAVEVKTWGGEYVVRDGKWFGTGKDGRLHKDPHGPSAQIRANAGALSLFLQSQGITSGTYVEPAVILAGEGSVTVDSSGTQVWTLDDLDAYMGDLRTRNARPDLQPVSVIQVLEGLASGYDEAGEVAQPYAPIVSNREARSLQPTMPIGQYVQPAQAAVAPARGRGMKGLAVIALGLVLLAGVAWLWQGDFLRLGGSEGQGSVGDGDGPATSGPAVVLRPDGASASGAAPSGRDSQGNATSYEAANVVDSDTTTAWRVPGNGVGQWLLVEFDSQVEVTEVGLVPGYAKVDPFDGTDRFKQNRRVRQARFEFSDGSSVEATFTDDPVVQMKEVGPVVTGYVRVVIVETLPPSGADGRDFAAISEVVVTGRVPNPR